MPKNKGGEGSGASKVADTPEKQNQIRRDKKKAQQSHNRKGNGLLVPGDDLVSQIAQDKLNAQGVELIDRLTPVMHSPAPSAVTELHTALFVFVDAYTSTKEATLRTEHTLKAVPIWHRREQHALNLATAKLSTKALKAYFTQMAKQTLKAIKDEQQLVTA